MTDEGQKAIEAAARAAGHAEGIEWDRLAPDTQEQLTVTAMAAIRAYLAALPGWPIWLIYSREHNAFWRPNSSGYTWDINAAGRYTHEEAVARCNTRDMQHDGSPSEVCMIAPEMLLHPPGLED